MIITRKIETLKNEIEEQKNILKTGFLKGLENKTGVDIMYYWEEATNFDELRNEIEDKGGFNVEIIYYSTAINYLKENDSSLRESLEIANEYGLELKNLNSEILASLLASKIERENFDSLESDFNFYFQEIEELNNKLERIEDIENDLLNIEDTPTLLNILTDLEEL